MRRLWLTLAALFWASAALANPVAPIAKAGVNPPGVPPELVYVGGMEFNDPAGLNVRKNGPMDWERDKGVNTNSATTPGDNVGLNCGQTFEGTSATVTVTGGGGQQGEWIPDCQYSATVGGGYPATGQVAQANGLLTLTVQPTPSQISGALPTTYCPFTVTGGTGGVSSTTLTVSAVTSGSVCGGSYIAGTGVSGTPQIAAFGTGTGGTGTYTLSSAQTIANGTTITNTGKWPFAGGWVTTRSSFAFKPPYCVATYATVPTVNGTWGVGWSQTRNQTITAQSNGQIEFDHPEYTIIPYPQEPATNFHYNINNSGGTYFNAGMTTKMTTNPQNGFHTYVVCAPAHVGQYATWWTDGILQRRYQIPTTITDSIYSSQFHYWILTLSAGNTSAFPAVMSPSASDTMKVDWVRVYKPRNSIKTSTVDGAGADYFINTNGDGTGLGAEKIQIDGSPTGASQCCAGSWTARGSATFTTGSSVDGLPAPAVITGAASGGSFLDGREYFGNTTLGNVANSQAYAITVDYNYGTSSSILVQFYTPADGTFYRATVAGTTVTVLQAGGGCTGVVTTVASHKHFACTFTSGAASAGYWDITVGPNSSSGSQNVTVYKVSVRPTSAIFP